MKPLLIVCILTALIFIVSCSDSPRDITLSDEYFPLQIGNKWYYQTTLGYNHTIEIIDTVRINGQLFFKTEGKYTRGRSTGHYTRYSDNKIYQKLGDREEYLFIDLSTPLDEPYSAYQAHMQTLVTRKASHETIDLFGKNFRNVIESYHQLPEGDNYHSYYARGIGLVALIWDNEDQNVTLRRAIIDGKTVFR